MQLALAPMEGLVDEPLRDVLTRVGGIDWCVTEFIRVNDQLLPAHVIHRFAPELQRRGAYTAAGSVITDDVPPGAMAVGRARQRTIDGWVQRKRPGSPAAEAAGRAGQDAASDHPSESA